MNRANPEPLDHEFILIDRLDVIRKIVTKYGEDKCYISFSGGKDSTVLSYLVDLALPNNKIPRVYANTGIELNIIKEFVESLSKKDDRIIMIKPKIPIKKMLEKEGYPFKSKHHSEMWNIWENNHNAKSAIKYRDGLYNFSANKCPKILRYQFDDGYTGPRISDKCCLNLKEKPLDDYMNKTGKTIAIVGIMRDEGGRRESAQCFVKYAKDKFHFHPLAVVSKNWEEWLINKYHIRLCDIYYPPYNFTRTGCKGCPFNPTLQKDLDTLEQYFPKERQQCEIIWKPVYDEYRRLGYRLKDKKTKQMSILDYLEEE
jgi:3'-phosphoadenosine 5'-phosphosulfate sulfotransferase (PAPS reductase)/FAD synthetase